MPLPVTVLFSTVFPPLEENMSTPAASLAAKRLPRTVQLPLPFSMSSPSRFELLMPL
jgi:hypothetical protein